MATIYEQAYFDHKVTSFKDANLSIASSAVLYGLSIYTVFHISTVKGAYRGFRLRQHYDRLTSSAKIIGLQWPKDLTFLSFQKIVSELLAVNNPQESVFVRATIHADALLPGTRTRGVSTQFSAFIYTATPIVKPSGVRLKTSQWRRVPDNSIPSRAKVNGAYVNSVLAHQDALDAGYDDCIFLDQSGHVCELAAANIFMVRNGVLITPDTSSDLLEGINRKAILEMATEAGIPIHERSVDLTELYIADEVFVCGTSAFVASVIEIDGRQIGRPGPITQKIAKLHAQALLSGDLL
ncbi:MAG: Branched-chain-amino-acid aminotransferase [Candidatus Saccharibacteria bacterium]|nr:Branched-chain-amino-acid aminotransferase [Candidatus Saccharibacteria bacterium]